MTHYFYQRDNSSIAEMNCYDYAKSTSKVVFDELVIKPSDDGVFYLLYANTQEFTDCKNSKDSNWKFKPNTKARLKIARKEYDKEDYKTKKNETIFPSLIEQALCKVIEILDNDNYAYKGNINFGCSSDNLIQFLGGKNLPDEVIQYLTDSFFDFSSIPINKISSLQLNELIESTNSKNGNGNYRPPKSEGDKLQEKFDWISKQIELKYPAIEIKSFFDITEDGCAEQKVPEELKLSLHRYVIELRNFVRDGDATIDGL